VAALVLCTPLPSRSATGLPPSQATAQPDSAAGARRALAAGRAEEARKLAEEGLANAPADAKLTAVRIEAEVALGRPEAALAAYEAWQKAAAREDATLAGQVARGYLWHIARTPGELAAPDALAALAAAGDGEARTALRRITTTDRDSAGAIPALAALADTGDQTAAGALVAAARGGSGQQRASALSALKNPRMAGVDAAIQDALGPTAPLLVRLAAIDAAGRLGVKAAVPLLVKLLDERPYILSLRAAKALHELGDSRGEPVLKTALTSDLPDIRLTAAQAYRSTDGPWEPAVRPLLDNPDGLFRLHAAELLLQRQRPAALRTLTQATTDLNTVVRNEAARILTADPATSPAELRRLLRDGSPVVRTRAAAALLRNLR
jgi:HEAT repeat protein